MASHTASRSERTGNVAASTRLRNHARACGVRNSSPSMHQLSDAASPTGTHERRKSTKRKVPVRGAESSSTAG
ncbi:hypothetical protein ACEE90_05405 [Corynebacterium phoceense]|uniref:hypothetical protein n=1 Tax=Corynebacterium phoceense TaxID=1686286 RepID=UPI00211C6E7C|nr:hypothetical protein [Corynebacterium phoceense]MCQ9335538.1 hypothetical protein [Corynebacterium phoceense]